LSRLPSTRPPRRIRAGLEDDGRSPSGERRAMGDYRVFWGEVHYRVRVEQRNGQRAWSSPIWVAPPSER
ncbi:MAG: hypothetical protein KAX19_05945, partial [Candidatus Brocadiae bacterium]|nr:hypothetical protein [Candidatus Brocadiia bacterium]